MSVGQVLRRKSFCVATWRSVALRCKCGVCGGGERWLLGCDFLVRNIIHEIMWKVSYVGPARGSVTGFYTAFLSEITQVNPLEYDLPEWRHLHEQRPELPD